ncbi:hypothetical protein [Allofustis seminis]|uniref:hypothetical protein n=1 Tax=Allofustis seminis TaxID=166939 RepID=UPI000360E989|nr:hypothetical protein [Allofustis seminis]
MPHLGIVAAETMTDFRILFAGIVILLVILLVASFVTRNNRTGISFATNITSALILMIIAILTMVTENRMLVLTDLKGDRLTFYMFLASVILGIANPILYKIMHKRSRSRRYRF